MSRTVLLRRIRRLAVAAGTLLAAAAFAADSDAAQAADQLKFGVRMAQRGLWSEALFRFEQAKQLAPSNAKVWNDLAVAYEAVGRFDDARAAYREAVRLAPADKDVKRNLSRFLEFYQGFKPQGTAPAKPDAPGKPEAP